MLLGKKKKIHVYHFSYIYIYCNYLVSTINLISQTSFCTGHWQLHNDANTAKEKKKKKTTTHIGITVLDDSRKKNKKKKKTG